MPVKRLSLMALYNRTHWHTRISRGSALGWGVQAAQPRECRDASKDGPGERGLRQPPDHACTALANTN